jgi:hypothetical protein
MHQIAPDTTKRSNVAPTHFHCYKWSSSGQEYERIGKSDTLDLNSPDRPPVRTVDWLIKSQRFIAEHHVAPKAARDWLVAEWEAAKPKALNPVPDWVSTEERGERALVAIETGCWPTWSQWLAGGTIVLWSVVGTSQACH